MINKIFGYIKILRPWFWLPALSPAMAGAIAAGGGSIPTLQVILFILFIFGPGIPGAAEAINDVFDVSFDKLKTINYVLGIPSSGGSGAIQKKILTPNEALVLALTLFSLTLALGLVIGIIGFILLLLGVICAIIYSVPPIRLKGRGVWGGIIQAIGYGMITFNTGWYLVTNQVTLFSIAVGGLIGISIIGYGSTADLADYDSDLRNNIRTLPIVYGKRKAKVFYTISMLIPYFVLLFLYWNQVVFFSWPLYIVLLGATLCIIYLMLKNDSPSKYSIVHMVGVLLESLLPFIFIFNYL